MFTGIISNLGKLKNRNKTKLTFSTDLTFCKKISKGISIAVNGACLTVFGQPAPSSFSVEVIPETKNKTTLSQLKLNDLVNLELPVTPSSFLAGHLVQGHVDAVTTLLNITKQGNSHLLKFSIPSDLAKYIAEKGSVAVNGISLTVIKVGKNYFTVGIIPYTWNNTMLKTVKINDMVNIEVDILAKYIEKLLR